MIPPITDPLGKHWGQPPRRFIEVDDESALMSEQTFKGLKEYSDTLPSGKYEGKMWRMNARGTWYLCWYSKDKNPKFIIVNRREILIL